MKNRECQISVLAIFHYVMVRPDENRKQGPGDQLVSRFQNELETGGVRKAARWLFGDRINAFYATRVAR